MHNTVLFVDDDPNIGAGLRRALQREPYRIVTASSPAEALDVLTRRPVDVVVSDERMPGMSGSDFLAQVRREYPKVIRMILTGHAALEAVIQLVNGGGIYHIFIKPCSVVELSVTIRHALQQKDLIEASRRLVQLVKSRSDLVPTSQQRYTGIAKVDRDEGGAVLIDKPCGDLTTLANQLSAHLERFEHLMGVSL